jgi:hypothetical protein
MRQRQNIIKFQWKYNELGTLLNTIQGKNISSLIYDKMYCIVKDNLFLVYVVKMLGGEGGCSKFIIFPLKFNDILPLSHSLSVNNTIHFIIN